MTTVISNIVPKNKLREIQLKTLDELKDSLICSFGPMGSNTCIKLDKAPNQYSKDGHTILKHINYNGVIEHSVKEDIESITRYITTTVGDGTTSAVILSNFIFKSLAELEDEHKIPPFKLIKMFKSAVSDIKEKIKKNAKPTTPEEIYNIAMISTNSNEEISNNLKNIYEEYGMDVFIDVGISNSTENMLKIYDGLTLNSGYADPCFVNEAKNNSCTIVNPDLYVFEDPIDTPEMIGLFDHIIATNIIRPWNEQNMESLVPTVILSPKLSRDMSSIMDSLAEFILKVPIKQRPPICIITNINQTDVLADIAKLSGATCIRKYIDPKIQEADIARGAAPTIENITSGKFNGKCDMVSADNNKTKFVRPKKMFNEDGSYSDIYNALIEFLERAVEKAKLEGEDNHSVGILKRRLNALKGMMVEYLVGGISMTDRDSLRDLVEDAVLNCRSAAQNGTGCAANFEGLLASYNYITTNNFENSIEYEIASAIYDAYAELVATLYSTTMDVSVEDINKYMDEGVKIPFNLVTGKMDNTAQSSIESDIVVLDTISKIVSIMFTCNQFVVPTSMHNIYIEV